MRKTTLRTAMFFLFAMFALQVQAQPCPELWLEPGIYKISTCGEATELFMTINGGTGDLEWATELTGDDPTQLWRVIDHREPAATGYVEIWATIPNVGDFTMAVDQTTFDGSGSDDEIRVTIVPGQPIGDTGDPNYEFDQWQRRKATGWTGNGNNALFAKPPGQGNLRYGVIPSAAGEPVLFQRTGAIDPLRFVLVQSLSNEAFDTSSIFVSNPVSNDIEIKGLTANVKEVSVYSLIGKEVLTREVNGEASITLDASALATGMYLVDIKGDNGSYTQKIIKQ